MVTIMLDEKTEQILEKIFNDYIKLQTFLLDEDVQVINKEGGEDLEKQWIKLTARVNTGIREYKKRAKLYKYVSSKMVDEDYKRRSEEQDRRSESYNHPG